MNFNRNLIESIKNRLFNILNEEIGDTDSGGSFRQRQKQAFQQRQAESRAANAEKNARKAEKQQLQTRLDQEMRNLSTSPPKGFDASDQNALRAAAIDKLQQDKDFVKRANDIGLTVGKYSGDGSAGSFGYRFRSTKEKEEHQQKMRDAGAGIYIPTPEGQQDTLGKDRKPFKPGMMRVDVDNKAHMALARAHSDKLTAARAARDATSTQNIKDRPKYVNPNSPEAYWRERVAKGEVPAHILEPKKLQIDLDKEREEAMDAASQRVLGFDARGMTPEQKRERLLIDIDKDFKSREAELMNKSINMTNTKFSDYMETEFPGHKQRYR